MSKSKEFTAEKVYVGLLDLKAATELGFTKVHANLAELNKGFKGLSGEVKALTTRFGAVEGKLEGVEGRLGVVEGKVDALTGKVDDLTTIVLRIDAKLP